MRDDHAHIMTDSGMKQSVTKMLMDEDPAGSGSSRYYVPSGDAQVYVGKIKTVDEVFSFTQSYARLTQGDVNIRLLWDGNDASLLNHRYTTAMPVWSLLLGHIWFSRGG
jgi:hypothetical protein